MTGLVVRKVRSSRGLLRLKPVPVMPRVIHGGVGVVKLERVQVSCPACGEQVEAVAADGQVKGYCAVARQSVDFLVKSQVIELSDSDLLPRLESDQIYSIFN